MVKIQSILIQLEKQTPQRLPIVSHVLESDIERISQALKKHKNDRCYYDILRVLMSDVKKALKHKDYSQPLLEISLSQLEEKQYIHQLKLKICEAIIDCEQFHRVSIVQHNVNALTEINLKQPALKVRLEIVRAGMSFLKGEFTKAASFYLNASRQEALIRDEKAKIQLLDKAIAFCYLAPRSQESHKVICTLCLNELTKNSSLYQILNKLYNKDMITVDQSNLIEKHLPASLNKIDTDGVSVFKKAKFSHNMVPILNAFKNISFDTLTHLLGLNIDETLILLEKIYSNGEIKIDQQKQLLKVMTTDVKEMQTRKMAFLSKIDDILTN